MSSLNKSISLTENKDIDEASKEETALRSP